MSFTGKAFCYGDDVNTDVIIPARYLNTFDEAELAAHCMEDIDPEFCTRVSPGDIIVAGSNFGCGSSREHAPIAIKASGVRCVIAESFARIFYRNCINIGLAILECPAAARAVRAGDTLTVELSTGTVTDETTNERFTTQPFPPFIREIIERGGLFGEKSGKNK